ncbi:CRISPR system precrRNA processing endoribonuclease RAMP protein Cas6 [Herpetosiphon geysericola]|uniref:CRISPR-associated protein Cas6 C-terminal domain-containing protein n=1 Tax=Herpetosiphon geysericola TaxID=70996 RepID=A0A0P6YDM2_9CHLR|nr:CRISPR system precrRNA processing endoribonuclease RAMP protein Cas6 [Herpetosiphon geysericola]KPL90183.1 hypothetical protein SE18_08235 [Herpetosiphon geysericola]
MDLVPPLPIMHLRLVYVFLKDAILPRWKGALLRGGWGRALSATFCDVNCEQPAQCSRNCPYRVLFTPEATPGQIVGVRDAPRPFVVRPPLADQTHFRRGDRLTFDVLLLGSAIPYAQSMIMAFIHLGRLGLGADRSPANLIQAFSFSEQTKQFLPCFQEGQWLPLAPPIQPQFFDAAVQNPGDRWRLQFVTPTRLKRDGTVVRQFDLPLVVGTAIRRLQQLNTCYGTSPWDAPIDALFAAARAAHTEESRLRWVDWGRTSAATGQAMQLGGLIGTLDVGGMNPALATFLTMASLLHVGKAAVFGNGWFRLQPRNPTP